jgi:hypothetical protein
MKMNQTFNQIASIQDFENLLQCRSFAGMFIKVKSLAHEHGMRKGLEFEDESYKKNHNEFVIGFMNLVINVAKSHYGKVETHLADEDIKVNRVEFLKWAEDETFAKVILKKLWNEFEYR